MPFRNLIGYEFSNTGIVNVKDHGAIGDGTHDDSATITTAINKANDGTLLFPLGTYKISSNVISPSNVTIWFTSGAKLSIDSGISFTINGKLDAGLRQIFSGSGTVVIAKGAVESLIPQWWGAVGDGINDDTSAFTTCITCAGTTNISIVPSNYKITNDITFGVTSNVNLIAPVTFTVSTGKTVTFSGRMFGDIPTLAGAGALTYSSAIINRDTRLVALTYASTIACNTDLGEIFTTTTVNATGNTAINVSGGIKGKKITFLITNDATTGKTITFNTGFVANGTLVGTINKTAMVEFVFDGTLWQEISRSIPTIIKNNQDVSTAGTPTFANLKINQNVYFGVEVDNGNSNTADTIDWTAGNKQKSTLNGNCTYTFTSPAGPCNLTLRLIQGGSYTVTWPNTVKWAGGVPPILSTVVSAVDIISFYWNGTNYYGAATIGY